MRLTEREIEVIKAVIKNVMPRSGRIILFGSRADDSARGGDIDLMIDLCGEKASISDKIKIQSLIQQRLGDQKIDLVLSADPLKDNRLVVQEALEKGVSL